MTSLNQCSICGAERPSHLGDLRPYVDADWTFGIYQCGACGTRWALRDPSLNYHEMLHSVGRSPYAYHYEIAHRVKGMLESNRLDACERYLKSCGEKYGYVIDFLKQHDRGGEILEIGCSAGFLTAFLRASGYNVEGIDVSESANSFASKTFGPFFDAHPRKRCYDLIFHLGLIGCVDNPRAFLSEYLGFLKPGGVMVFNAPNVESPMQLKELWVDTPPPDLIYLYNEAAFRMIIDRRFGVHTGRITVRDEVIRKNVKKKSGRPFVSYPVAFSRGASGEARRNNHPRVWLKRIFWSLCGTLYKLKAFRPYDSQYGLMVTIRRHSCDDSFTTTIH